MNHRLVPVVALLGLFGLAGAAQAAAPLTAVSCTNGVTGCAFALDDQFPPEGQFWQQDTAWWTGFSDSVTYTLSGVFQVTGLTVSLDNNDSYVIEASTNGVDWDPLLFVGASIGNVGGGMDTFSTVAGDPQFDAFLASIFTPAAASQIRITSVDGDALNSVGELQITAVPEPGTWLLMALGLAAVGLRRRG